MNNTASSQCPSLGELQPKRHCTKPPWTYTETPCWAATAIGYRPFCISSGRGNCRCAKPACLRLLPSTGTNTQNTAFLWLFWLLSAVPLPSCLLQCAAWPSSLCPTSSPPSFSTLHGESPKVHRAASMQTAGPVHHAPGMPISPLALCTMHHAPCTMHHAPCTRHAHWPCALCTMHHAPCTMHHAPGMPIGPLAQCTMHHAPCTRHAHGRLAVVCPCTVPPCGLCSCHPVPLSSWFTVLPRHM